MILALDISLRTGFAYGAEADNIRFGMRGFTAVEPDNAVRGRMFRQWLCELMTEIEPQELVIERPILFQGARSGATELLIGLAWEADRAAELRNIPRRRVAPITIKKFITGNARAKKPEVIAAVKARGFNVLDDNSADAVALLLYAMEGK